MDSRKPLLRGYKHDRFGKRPAATEAEENGDRSTEVDVNAPVQVNRAVSFSFPTIV